MLKAGERLKEEREKKGITLEEASSATKIRSSFLLHIEQGQYNKLPSAAYAQGFVRNYTRFLGLSEKEIMSLFRREYDETKTYRVLPQGFSKREDFPLRRFKLKNTVILGVLIFVALFLYMIFQYRSAFLGPTLDVSSPKDKVIITSSDVLITGKTSSDSTLFVNGESVTVSNDGSFKKDINVFPGDNKIIIRSVNRFGKETSIVRNIEVK